MFYPNKNMHFYPSFVGKRAQFTKSERRKDKTLCRLRWVNEANFSRMLYVRCLKDIVEWHVIKLIPDAVSRGFAVSNVQQPFHAAPSAHNGGRDGEADVSSGDEGNDSQDSSRECMSSSEEDDVSEYDEDHVMSSSPSSPLF